MIRFLPYVAKNLLRHRVRTLLTISGAAVALGVFAVVGAVQDGLAGLTRNQQSERALIVFQANRFCPSTSKLPENYADQVAKMSGVADVIPIQVFMNNCRASLDLVVFNGVPPEKLRSFRDLTLEAGDWSAFASRQNAAIVGSSLARRRGLSVGHTFSIGEVSVQIAGIYRSPIPGEENYLYAHLPFLQRTRGLNAVGVVTQLEVKLAEGADPDAVAKAIDERFRGGPIATDSRPKGMFQAAAVADLAEVIGMATYLGFACVALVLALVATTTVMAVQDRVREYAVLQTLGFSGPRIFGLVITESLLVSLVGGLLGLGIALAGLHYSGLSIGTEGVSIAFLPSPRVALIGLAVTLAIGALAGLAPAWRAARAEIVESLRYAG
jgi:putative ABC transport system permease protein